MALVLLNGKLIPAENATVSAQDRGFRYGDGVYETLRVKSGRIWQLDAHMKRLENGLRAIKINSDINTIKRDTEALLKENKLAQGLLRIQVTRGPGNRGYLPDATYTPTVLIETNDLPKPPAEPVKLWLSTWKKISPKALPVQYKLTQGLNSTLARIEAAEHQCFEALLLNERGEVCETTSGNIFWRRGSTLFTPSLACGVLEGTVRGAIMRLYPSKVQEIEATLESLLGAEAVVITNAAWLALAAGSLAPENARFESAALAGEIRALLEQDGA